VTEEGLGTKSLFDKLVAGFIWAVTMLFIGTVAMIVASVTLVMAIIGIASKVLAEILTYLAELLREALPFLLSLAPQLLRAGIVLAVMGAVVYGWPLLYLVYAIDLPFVLAGVMATMIVAAPIGYAVLRQEWAILLASAPIIFVCAWILARAGPGVRVAVIIVPLVLFAASSIFERRVRDDGQERWDQPGGWDSPSGAGLSDGVHDVELPADDDGEPSADRGDPGDSGLRGRDDLLGVLLQPRGVEQPADGDQRVADSD
jgi:hypothetical protein